MSCSKDNILLKMATDSLQFSHSPYSKKRIAASLKLTNGKMYSGCNIENASYGGTVCAERVAIFKAYSENLADQKIEEIIVLSEADEPWPPCGFCRQVIAEFGKADTKITICNSKGYCRHLIFSEIFPEAFSPLQMSK